MIPWPNLTTAMLASGAVGALSAFLAHKRGRNPYFWFFIGFAFGLVGIMAIFFAPFSKKKAAPQQAAPQPYISGPSSKFWYYLDAAHQQHGPMSLDALTKAWKEGTVLPTSFVWHEGLPDWKPLQEMIRLRQPN